MTDEEAIKNLKKLKSYHNGSYGTTIDMAIKALEQSDVLDKIRAEIENDWQLNKYPSSPFSCGLRRAIEIIDKYKAESEEE